MTLSPLINSNFGPKAKAGAACHQTTERTKTEKKVRALLANDLQTKMVPFGPKSQKNDTALQMFFGWGQGLSRGDTVCHAIQSERRNKRATTMNYHKTGSEIVIGHRRGPLDVKPLSACREQTKGFETPWEARERFAHRKGRQADCCGHSMIPPTTRAAKRSTARTRPNGRVPYGLRYKVAFKFLRKMPSDFPKTPFLTNKHNEFTGSTCKIVNIFRPPYGFTARRP
ncbi:MAG: hypothetical protein JWM16_1531 [Verrucomicrobiales bacterium]|nr:hypothetical protein [Verrucomicrobiales bacterium]